MGRNLKSNFSSGSNFGIHLNTPIRINLGKINTRIGTDIYFSKMNSIDNRLPYNILNIVGTISVFPIEQLELKTGFGISPSSIGDYKKILYSIPVDINYYLPFKLGGFGLALNLHAQETLGIPTDVGTEDTAGTSEFINVGFFITTPLKF